MREGNAIEVRDICKRFKIYHDKGFTLKEKVLFRKRRKYEERCVLDHISFSVRQGEAIGLVGHNGCGKSTTLKLLTRIMYPDSGSIEIKGRVSSLIELGAGFHPDMSGRENIYINAAIFGLTRREIDRRLQDIIDFSELEEFIDNPVRTYSSGMYMRLAFSVAINVDAEILLIDEILGVGDANFQIKCFEKLKEIKRSGTTIVIVSHSLGQIEEICDRSLWIHEGKIREEGFPEPVHASYLKYMEEKRAAVEPPKDPVEEIPNFPSMYTLGNAKITENAIILHENATLYGPYLNMEPGKIEIDAECIIIGDESPQASITAEAGQKVLETIELHSGLNVLNYEFKEAVKDFEFVVRTGEQQEILFKHIFIRKVENKQ